MWMVTFSIPSKIFERKKSKVFQFLCHELLDLGVGKWVSGNPNIVQICKSIQTIARSLNNNKPISINMGLFTL